MSLNKYAISTDEETYIGDFITLEAALAEMTDEGRSYWVGVQRKPLQPENFIDVDRIIDEMYESGEPDWSFDFTTDRSVFLATRQQLEELENSLKDSMAKWLDKYDLRPDWFCIDDPFEYVVSDGKPVQFVSVPKAWKP